MTNGVPLGTAKDVVCRVTSSDPTKTLGLGDGTVLKGALIFEGIRSLANSNKPAKRVGISVITEEEHDYLVVDTKHGVCVIHAESCPCHKKK